MKIPVKRCTLCGALVADCPEDVALHRKFHERTAARPVKRTTVTNRCPVCNAVLEISGGVGLLVEGACPNPRCPRRRPPPLEEPTRRPAPLTPGMRAASQRQRDRQEQQFVQDIGDAPGPPRVTHDPDEKVRPDDVNGLLYVPGTFVFGLDSDVRQVDGQVFVQDQPGAVPPVFDGAYGALPRRRKADAEDEPRAMYASPVRKDLGPQFGS